MVSECNVVTKYCLSSTMKLRCKVNFNGTNKILRTIFEISFITVAQYIASAKDMTELQFTYIPCRNQTEPMEVGHVFLKDKNWPIVLGQHSLWLLQMLLMQLKYDINS